RFLVSSAVRAIMAQRLVRKLCSVCKQEGELSEIEMRRLNLDSQQIASAKVFVNHGCNKCRSTGYKGRMGIFEIFNLDEEGSRMINDGLSTPQLRKRARELGMRTLREDGVRKILAGDTTASEIVRVTMADAS
ncbi:MAG: type IV pilus assembly protein PilB, partial [Verrucomicrobiales bacterium]